MPSWLKASSSLSCAWQSPWSSPCVPGELRGEVRLWWDGVFTAPATGETQGWGSCCLQPPPQGLSPPGVLGFGGFIGFERVARFNLLGVLQADPLLQPDPSSSPGSPDPCRPQRPCSSNNPPCNVGKMPISSVFCPKPSHAGGLGHPEVHTEVAGCFKPTCKWNGAAAEPGFSFPSHLLARLPEGSAFLRSPLHGFRGLCSTRWRGGIKKNKNKIL